LRVVRFLSLLLTAVALGAALAHLLALPNQIHLSREDCLIAFAALVLSVLVTGETRVARSDERRPSADAIPE
jgi:hypothetical protein